MKAIPRRTVLRGIAGGAAVSLGLPVLEAMLDSRGHALAGGAPLPKRFVTFHFGNGAILPRWVPAATGTAWELTPQLLPLAPVKAYCSVLSGFELHTDTSYPHHAGMSGVWSGRSPVLYAGGTYFGGRSLDQLAADAIGGSTRFRSLEIGVSKRVANDGGPTLSYFSHRGTYQPYPSTYSPKVMWQRLFGVPVVDPAGTVRGGVLGAVAEDVKRLRNRVGAADRLRLDEHLTSVEQLQAQVLAAAEPGPVVECDAPAEPSEQNADIAGAEPLQAVSDAMNALLAHAFRCDLTRVASVFLTGPSCKTVYANLGHASEQHQMTHEPGPNLEQIHEAIVWNVQQFSNLLQALAATAEGAGTLLDRTVAVLGSDCSEGWTHGSADLPLLVAGGGGGALVPGQHLRAPGRSPSDVMLAALRAVAPGTASFGGGAGASSTPVAELLA